MEHPGKHRLVANGGLRRNEENPLDHNPLIRAFQGGDVDYSHQISQNIVNIFMIKLLKSSAAGVDTGRGGIDDERGIGMIVRYRAMGRRGRFAPAAS
jgi:hypothetical protein